MGRKPKISYEDKIRMCEDYLSGKASASDLEKQYGLSGSGKSIWEWVRNYRENGPSSLLPKNRNSTYTAEFKKQAVEAYLAAEGSLREICMRYQIPGSCTLRSWIRKYNNLEELEDYKPRPEVYMADHKRKTTQDERAEIVKYCIEHDQDYKETAALYDVSYTQVYSWVRKYLENGEAGLNDRRGKRKEEAELSEVEKLQRQIKLLERKLRETEIENELLKKVEEIERRRSSPKDVRKRNISQSKN